MVRIKRFVECGILFGWSLALLGAAGLQQPIFRGGSDIVRVFVTVTDHDGRLVTNLARDSFEIRDEGKPQPITQFDNSPQPIRLIVMLDVSGSMEGNLPLLRAAGRSFSRGFAQTTSRVSARSGTTSPSVRRSPMMQPSSTRHCQPQLRRTPRRRSGARSTARLIRSETGMTDAR